MRKIFTFMAAMLIALTANATTWNITPTECFEGHRDDGYTLYITLDRGALDGDTIVMADGEYTEPLTMTVAHNVYVKAAAGARPVVKMSGYFQLQKTAKFEGIVFDHTNEANNSYGFYIQQDTHKNLIVEDCEFKGFNMYCFQCAGGSHIDSITVNNSYFHNLTNGVFYLQPSGKEDKSNMCDYLSVTNTTFANINISKWVAVIDFRNNDGNGWAGKNNKLIVDHCTFYNCSGTYPPMIQCYISPDASITNCIFANPATVTNYATYAYGGNVKNCLFYNNNGCANYGVTVTDTIIADPMFLDSLNANYTLGIGSRAIGAGTDGSNLGDPFWGKAKRLYCKMEHNWWTQGSAAIGAYAWDVKGKSNAAWPGKRMTRVSDDSESADYTTWTIDLPEKYGSIVFTRMNPSDIGDQYWGAKTEDLTIPTNGNLFTIDAAEKWDDDSHSHQTATGSWSVKDAKFYIAGSMTDWDNDKIGSLEDSYTLSLAAGKHQLKAVDLEGNWHSIADLTAVAGGLYYDQDGNVCFILENAGDVTITYNAATPVYTVTGTFVAPEVKLIGINGWTEATDAIALTPAEDKLSASVTMELTNDWYDFKVIRAGEWLGKTNDGTENYKIHKDYNWVDALVRDYEGLKSISLQPSETNKNYTFTWNYAQGKLTVTFPSETGIENTEAEMKAVKRIENGQLFIEKGNKIYNVLGVQIR